MSLSLRASSVLLLLITASSLCSLSVAERDDFYDEKVETLGIPVELNCTNSAEMGSIPNDSIPISWMLPNLTVLYGNDGRFQILHSNWTLKITNVSTEDFGLYHCMLQTPAVEWVLMSIGLNAGGPYFEDLWDKYWLNTVIGLSAFFGFLLLTLVAYLLYRFRYQAPDDDDDSRKFGRQFERNGSDVRAVSIVSKVGDINDAFNYDMEVLPTEERSSTSSSDETTSSDDHKSDTKL